MNRSKYAVAKPDDQDSRRDMYKVGAGDQAKEAAVEIPLRMRYGQDEYADSEVMPDEAKLRRLLRVAKPMCDAMTETLHLR